MESRRVFFVAQLTWQSLYCSHGTHRNVDIKFLSLSETATFSKLLIYPKAMKQSGSCLGYIRSIPPCLIKIIANAYIPLFWSARFAMEWDWKQLKWSIYHPGFGGSSLHFQAAHAGQDLIRPLWKHYFLGSHAMIFVVDSCWAKVRNQQKSNLRCAEWNGNIYLHPFPFVHVGDIFTFHVAIWVFMDHLLS